MLRSRLQWTLVSAPVVLALAAAAPGVGAKRESPIPATHAAAESVVVAAVGDIVCGAATPEGIPCLHAYNAALVQRLNPDAVLLMGDLQYETGSLEDFGAFYEPTWGQFRERTYPVPGNHEYYTAGARGYFDYFNGVGADSGRAGHRKRGYYSFDLGAWHVVALNSNCREVGGCGAGSPQERWLRADLQASQAKCTLAYWHSARFSSGEHGDETATRPLWQALYDHHADLILQGHDHHYERFGPQDAAGRTDPSHGIRSFVVGTGGKGTGGFKRPRPNSELRDHDSIGVLRLVLHPDRYEWQFVSVPPATLADSGADLCHGPDGALGGSGATR